MATKCPSVRCDCDVTTWYPVKSGMGQQKLLASMHTWIWWHQIRHLIRFLLNASNQPRFVPKRCLNYFREHLMDFSQIWEGKHMKAVCEENGQILLPSISSDYLKPSCAENHVVLLLHSIKMTSQQCFLQNCYITRYSANDHQTQRPELDWLVPPCFAPAAQPIPAAPFQLTLVTREVKKKKKSRSSVKIRDVR